MKNICREYRSHDAKSRPWLHLVCPAGLQQRWHKQLRKEWQRRYPQLFDKDDFRLASSQRQNHFAEWVAAVHLFETKGVHAVVGKWKQVYPGVRGGFRKYPKKAERVRARVGKVRYEKICRKLQGQGPDLFLYRPSSSRCWFAEVKRDDRLSASQEADFKIIEQVLRIPVQLIRVHLEAPRIAWEDADELQNLGHGIEIHHDDVPGTAVAFIVGFDWFHSRGAPARVRVLKRMGHRAHRAAIKRAVVRVLAFPLWDGSSPRTRNSANDRRLPGLSRRITRMLRVRVNG